MQESTQLKLLLLGLFLAVLGIILPGSTSTTTGIQWVVNNTNMAPFVAGHGGTGERIGDNTTYWNNETPIEIFLYSHANTTGTAAEIHLYINGTKVADTSGRALGVAEQSNRSIVATIPQYSYYSAEFVNYHHIEWYEYKILTGNVTTTTTGNGGGCSDCDLKINKSGDNLTANPWILYSASKNTWIYLGNTSATLVSSLSPILNNIGVTTSSVLLTSTNSTSGENKNIRITPDSIKFITNVLIGSPSEYSMNNTSFDMNNNNITNANNISSTTNLNLILGNGNYSFNSTGANWNGANLINCSNCWNETVNNTKVNKTGDNMTGTLNILSSAFLNLTTTNTFNFDFATVPRLYRNVTSTAIRTSPLATLNMILGINTGYIDNGGGPAVIFWNKNNVSTGETEYNIGRVATVWQNRTLNSSKISFYARNGIVDLNGLTPVLDAYTAQNNVSVAPGIGDIMINSTVETGNLKLLNLSGAGNAYVCVDSIGKLYRGSPGC